MLDFNWRWKLKSGMADKPKTKEKTMSNVKKFFIAGVQHHHLHKVIDDLEIDELLELVPEPDNKYDPNAVRIESNGTMCGYVPRKFSAEVSAMIEVGALLNCVVVTLNKKAKPWEQCEVEISEFGSGDPGYNADIDNQDEI